ncbi:MAG TPA: DNA integrity scanning protein DisA nucleotide-binding domain protein [Candidatus Ornithoclostridium faecigallinarum]|nr:DNA integrity scanning protein DisA nucleotide-binding domain protein [Candidatus Ornithoclostridium faecigallinarum]
MNIYGLTSVDMTEYVEHIGWYSIIDLVVLCAVFALIFVFFKKRNSIKLAIFTVTYILLYILVTFAGVYAEKWLGESGIGFMFITKRVMDFGAIFLIAAFAVVYQSDLKVIFSKISRTSEKSGHYEYETSDEDLTNSATQIVKACQNMAKNDVGALIIIVRTEVPSHILDTGTRLEAVVTSGLLESIFSTKGPLHDGAVVIKGERVLSAGCFLPLSQEVDIAKELGTRHRAAIGITEESDVLAIVVSEETGIISTVDRGKIKRYMTPDKLFEQIKQAYGVTAVPRIDKKEKKKFL